MLVEYGATINIPTTPEVLSVTKHYRYIDKEDNILFSCWFDRVNNIIRFPRDLYKFYQHLAPLGFELDFNTTSNPTKKYVKLTTLQLKEFQKPIAQEVTHKLKKDYNVVLNAETGLGKSYLVPYFISELQQRTLVLVDRTTLAKQMFDEITANSDADVKILKNSCQLTDINIATIQMLIRNPELMERIRKEIGFVIVDECHFVSVNTFTDVVQSIPSKYRLGLSATPTRSDGMTEVIYDVMGRSMVIGKNPNALQVGIHRVFIPSFFSSGTKDYKKKLAGFLKVNKKSITDIIGYCIEDNRSVCLAVDIKEVQYFFQDILNTLGIPSEVVNSDINVNTRAKIFSSVNSEKTKVLIGMAVLEKGVSIPRLDTIVHLSGAGTKEKVNQLMGRLKRDHPDKRPPLLIDLCFLGNLEKQQNVRLQEYKHMGVPVKRFEFDRYLRLWKVRNQRKEANG